MHDANPAPSPFHAGEIAVQHRLGHRGIEVWARQIIRDHMPPQHRAFHTSLPFLVISARDEQGRPWASILTGDENCATSPDPKTLRLDSAPEVGDPLFAALTEGADIGVLGIDLAARRRNRLNARITGSEDHALTLAVNQTFGNCPQYIQDRRVRRVTVSPGKPLTGTRLTHALASWIEEADTFFIASGYGQGAEDATLGMDASHRGGAPAFVEVLDARRIRFPDFAGNQHYNTLGNIAMDSRAGLLFVDFASGSLLHLTGRATIDWDGPEVARIPGAERLVTLEIDAVVERPFALPLRWSERRGAVRSMRVVEKVRESADVTSFVLEARDGGILPGFAGGQHLPLALALPGQDVRVERSYSLSGNPADGRYRISVKREPNGLASRHLHDGVEVGEIISTRAPAGDFTLPHGAGPLVLVSAGIGVTPMLSMLHELHATRDTRPVHFVNGARDGIHHPMAAEVRDLIDRHGPAELTVAYSRPLSGLDVEGRDFDHNGRIDARLVASLTGDDTTVLICGPVGFTAELRAGLIARGVSEHRILTETFGSGAEEPRSLQQAEPRRHLPRAIRTTVSLSAGELPVTTTSQGSSVSEAWVPSSGRTRPPA